MTDGLPDRTWDSVCGDCAHCSGDACDEDYITAGSGDCIAAICEGFLPKEKGDA